MEKIRIGLLGAGIFAQRQHIPALLRLADRFEVVAVCARSQASTDALNALLPRPAQVYHDLHAFIAHPALDAVDVLLPIPMLAESIALALSTGKHIISEKPIAATTLEAHALIEQWLTTPQQVWMVAENYRYGEGIRKAHAVLQGGMIGKPRMAHWAVYSHVANSPYIKTDWRANPQFQGGFILDGGIHHLAGWRSVLGNPVQVSSKAINNGLHAPTIPDTLVACFAFEEGLVGTHAVTYKVGTHQPQPLTIVGELGELYVMRDTLKQVTANGIETFEGENGIKQEFEAFADAIQHGTPHLNTPIETYNDLALLETLFKASDSQRWEPVPYWRNALVGREE